MRRAARKDDSQAGIVQALRGIGASVEILNGANIPDLLVGYKGHTFLLEIKTKSVRTGKDGYVRSSVGNLRPGQIRFHAAWKGGYIGTVYSPAEAVAVLLLKADTTTGSNP